MIVPTLDDIFDDIWRMLIEGSRDRDDPFHHMVVGTSGDGGAGLRTVILRLADPGSFTLFFHTDIRTDKVREIERDNRLSLLFYDPRRKVQVRASATATIHYQDEVARHRWNASSLSSRRCYLAPLRPGQEVAAMSHNLPEDLLSHNPSRERSEAGFENFCAVACEISDIDWLYLRGEGHMRARFSLAQGEWRKTWVAP